MMFKFLSGISMVALLASCGVQNVSSKKLSLDKAFVDTELRDAAKQIKYLASSIDDNAIPTTFQNGKHVNWATSWWCSGFYPGTVLYLYEYTKDPELLDEAKEKLKLLEKEKFNKTTHDLGFMLFCSFGNALRITGDSTAYKEILVTGAESLSSRYRDVTKTIRSWDGGKNWEGQPWTYPVIIDNMMNLEFLTQSSKISGNDKFKNIAITHANTTLKNHFRPNNSAYHVIDYNDKTGEIIGKKNAQGAYDESAWSRGQAWALYGYVTMYRETQGAKYLEQARKIAQFYLNHPNLPKDLIPYWDMDQHTLTEESKYYSQKDLKDASTAAIMASGLIELSLYTKGKESTNYISKAEGMIKSLSKAPYKAAYKDNGGFILKHSVGSIPHKTEVDVPLTYADYYYVEALLRYDRMLKGDKVIKQ